MPLSRGRTWLFAAVALMLANPLLHKTISDVCDWARALWGFAFYDRVALVGIPLASVLAAAPFAARKGQALLRRPLGLVSVVVLAAITLAAQRWLLVANIELIHFPQFALLAVLLLAAGLSGLTAFLTAAAAGILDETYQYFVVYAGVSGTYFDINDIVLNTIGAAWGVVLFADALWPDGASARTGRVEPQGDRPSLASAWGLRVAVLFALLLALWLDPPTFSPLLRPTASGRALYRVLSAGEGVVVCTCLCGLVAFLTRDDRIATGGPAGWSS